MRQPEEEAILDDSFGGYTQKYWRPWIETHPAARIPRKKKRQAEPAAAAADAG